jgi:hypothetical protein
MTPLVHGIGFRLNPQSTDSLPNYLLRLTADNGYKNSIQLLRSANCKLLNNRLPGKKIFFGDFDLERVAMLANINIAQVEALKFRQVSNLLARIQDIAWHILHTCHHIDLVAFLEDL